MVLGVFEVNKLLEVLGLHGLLVLLGLSGCIKERAYLERMASSVRSNPSVKGCEVMHHIPN